MQIRFGYVANALALWDCSPSKALTFTRWEKLEKQEREEKLYTITKQNITNTMRALHYNIGHDIPLYRISSSIVPLATHPEVDFDYIELFREDWKALGLLVKKHNLRVSFHPNQFTLFTSDQAHITENALVSMNYHYTLFEAMGLDSFLINIHIGGAYGNKTAALARFYENIKRLPLPIKGKMTLENDDKTYTTSETLTVCQAEGIPLVFDYHHYIANKEDDEIAALLPAVFATWDHLNVPPKIHLSSPKSEREVRAHADYVDLAFIQPFLRVAKELGRDFDVMIESKHKDQALLRLMDEMEKVRGYKRIGGATFQL